MKSFKYIIGFMAYFTEATVIASEIGASTFWTIVTILIISAFGLICTFVTIDENDSFIVFIFETIKYLFMIPFAVFGIAVILAIADLLFTIINTIGLGSTLGIGLIIFFIITILGSCTFFFFF